MQGGSVGMRRSFLIPRSKEHWHGMWNCWYYRDENGELVRVSSKKLLRVSFSADVRGVKTSWPRGWGGGGDNPPRWKVPILG